LNPRSLIQPSNTILIELTGTHLYIYMLIEEEEIGEFVPGYIGVDGKLKFITLSRLQGKL